MSKSSQRSPFGWSNRGGTVTVIEAPVARSYRRRATIAFWVTVGVVGLLAATVASHYLHPIVGALLGSLIGAACGAAVFALIVAWPVLRVFWHWLPEILLGLVAVYGWTALMQSTPLWGSLLVVALVVGLPAAIGPVRRRVMAFIWCLVVRHRLRLCFAAFIATNRSGSLPLILPAKPTPAGERVWVWLRPGLSLRDLEQDGQVQKLAVACWANEVRVMRASRRYAALIRLDITRREPLAATIVSPLPEHVPTDVPANAPTSSGMPPVGLDLPDVPDTLTAETPRPRRPRNTPAAGTSPNGFDPSDYA
ncbi:hypothetical protein Q2K19_24065 [Micromonospora soli]|uniref:hypothetical protein n=1 Tax=Micromonospora sp. NBRC 110009 TaxID=3061627 RepID=UPI0026739590|nr:hypothetical protein [Micromonospora sp. NBRC 110009]WKT97227.1 hypothetical protein Q2K19_24065 [Micromonospora sp. NBRC 110009]